MATQMKNMTHGSPLRLIAGFSLPLMVGNLFQQLYTTVDSIIVGQGVGVTALAALGASDWLYWMFLWTIQGFTQGFSVMIAQAFGSGDTRRLRRTTFACVILSGIFAVVLTSVSLLVLHPLLALLHTPEEVIGGSQLYLTILFLGNTIVIAYNMSAGVLRAFGNSKLPLLAMITASCVNVALDALFVLYFRWGIAGAACATLLAQLLAFLICLNGLRKNPLLKPEHGDWTPEKALYGRLCGFAIPLGLQNGIISIGGLVVQSVLNGFGVAFIAAYTAANKLNGVLESVAYSFGTGLSTYMGQNQGAGKTERLDAGLRVVSILAVVLSLSIGGAMFVLGEPILSLFISAQDAASGEALPIALHYLHILCFSLIILFFLHVYRNALQGLGNVTGPVLSGVMEFIMRVGAALLLPTLLGQEGIFFCEPAAYTGAAVTLIVTYYLCIGKIKQNMRRAHATENVGSPT